MRSTFAHTGTIKIINYFRASNAKTKAFIITGSLLLLCMAYLSSAFLWALAMTPTLFTQYQQSSKSDNIRLSAQQLEIVKKVEDPSLDTNIGVDIFADGQGKTTISQSLARDIYLYQEVPGIAGLPQGMYRTTFKYFKAIDLGRDVMAIALNMRTDKNNRLNAFVNNVYVGSSDGKAVYGIDDAAKAYYGRSVALLSEREFISLVAMLKEPTAYHVLKNPDANAERVSKIVNMLSGKCKASGLLDDEYKNCQT